MSYNHVMIDLETLDTKPTAAIVSIGAVRFDLLEQKLADEFYRVVEIESCMSMGLTVGSSTIKFWTQQSKEARDIFSDKAQITDSSSIQQALQGLTYFLSINPSGEAPSYPILWGNPAMFDNAILTNAYQRCILPYPVDRRNNRCYATIKRTFDPQNLLIPKIENRVEHHALDDAKFQAQHLINIITAMRSASLGI